MATVSHYFFAVQTCKRPLVVGNYLGRAVLVFPHHQRRLPVIDVTNRVGLVLAVGQEVSKDNRMRLESDRNLAGNRFAVRVQGFRNVNADQAGCSGRHVVLPTAPNYGVALAHQEAIARPQPLPGAVEIGQYGGVAPVHHVKYDAVAAPRRVFGLQDAEVGDAVRATGGIPGSQLQVGDDLVGRVVGVNCQVN